MAFIQNAKTNYHPYVHTPAYGKVKRMESKNCLSKILSLKFYQQQVEQYVEVDKGLVDTAEEREARRNWESITDIYTLLGFPCGANGKEPTCQCRRYKGLGFNPWVRKIPWRRAWQFTAVSYLQNLMDRGAWEVTPGSQRIGHDSSDLAHTHTHTLSCVKWITRRMEAAI